MPKKVLHSILYQYTIRFNKRVVKQRESPNSIPVIIINFNQLDSLKKLIDFLLDRKIENIVIIDNQSDYPPLLEYYKSIESRVNIELMDKNYGHMVFFENKSLQKKYGQGYYIVTDADILPNPNLPKDFIQTMIQKMDKYKWRIVKVGFALDTETIPDHYPLKERVVSWESKYWEKELEKDVFSADIDTTFALYKPFYPTKFKVSKLKFYRAIRLAGDFTSKHMGWYINPRNMTEEQSHYMKTSSGSSSWKFDENGNLLSSSYY
ncbi:glycosyltransferase [Sphingobacterium sp. DN00404]|uniref:Glycosyltransferase n=1 Tax=Sphingobacterium micropteri TaxID=2763501 RepID=A0ABR7YR56_9SPHI|nr:glycosyltransferase [Sphingobacterium micropteri]MBD1433814.1 glycosyltransferase [Sphingobacterium micropteri]